MKDQDRIASLDGIRMVAISIVVVGHLSARFRGSSPSLGLLWGLLGTGGAGVDVFFVLSGFLITSLLLREYDKTGRISLRHFYLRRAFRILPAFYLYLGMMVIISLVAGWTVPAKGLVLSALFLEDYASLPHAWQIAHTWSLAVEEQFYIFWPLMLIVLLRLWGRRAAIAAAMALIVIAPAVRIWDAHHDYARFANQDFMMLHTRVDTLMFGCLFALCAGGRTFEAMFKFFSKVWWIFPLWFLLAGNLATRYEGIDFRLKWDMTLNGLALAYSILFLARNPGTWSGRFLNLKPVAFVGVLSYGIYLWQELFTSAGNQTWTGSFPWLILGMIVFPLLSYYLVETPLLRFRAKVFPSTPSTKLVADGPLAEQHALSK